MLKDLVDFCNYWWFRYLMVTELYMVEKWERITIHVIFALLFCLFWYFNYSVLLSITGNFFLGSSYSAAKYSVDVDTEPSSRL